MSYGSGWVCMRLCIKAKEPCKVPGCMSLPELRPSFRWPFGHLTSFPCISMWCSENNSLSLDGKHLWTRATLQDAHVTPPGAKASRKSQPFRLEPPHFQISRTCRSMIRGPSIHGVGKASIHVSPLDGGNAGGGGGAALQS